MFRAVKGEYGYTDAHKKAQALKTLVFFLIPVGIFLLGYLTTGGRNNLFTVVALVGCLPGCKELVNVLMFAKRKSMPRELYEEIASHVGDMTAAYELVLTTYEKNYPIHSIVICGNEIVGYTTKRELDLKKAAAHMESTLKSNGISGVHVHIFPELKQFLDRVDVLAEKEPEKFSFEGDERYPGMSREQVIREILLALSI